MNVRLVYQSGQQYSEHFSDFDVKVSRGTTRVRASFKEKGGGRGYSAWSLPLDKAQQLAYALLTACAGDAKPVEFGVEEPPTKSGAT
jgi:hypothetical protein